MMSTKNAILSFWWVFTLFKTHVQLCIKHAKKSLVKTLQLEY